MLSERDDGSRLDQLLELRAVLAGAIDNCESMRDLSALSRQYRETIREIEEIKGVHNANDEIEDILSERKNSGRPGAVRKSRSTL